MSLLLWEEELQPLRTSNSTWQTSAQCKQTKKILKVVLTFSNQNQQQIQQVEEVTLFDHHTITLILNDKLENKPLTKKTRLLLQAAVVLFSLQVNSTLWEK